MTHPTFIHDEKHDIGHFSFPRDNCVFSSEKTVVVPRFKAIKNEINKTSEKRIRHLEAQLKDYKDCQKMNEIHRSLIRKLTAKIYDADEKIRINNRELFENDVIIRQKDSLICGYTREIIGLRKIIDRLQTKS
jgi:hypothetical protein